MISFLTGIVLGVFIERALVKYTKKVKEQRIDIPVNDSDTKEGKK